jgi:hypothetical protein
MMTMIARRVAPLAFMLAACTHDFDVFEPIGEGGAPEASAPDAATADAAEASPADTSPSDSADAPSEASPACAEAGAITFGGHCYFATPAAAAWDASRTTCSSAGAHLVTLGSAAEETAVLALAPTKDKWIGMSRPVGSPPKDASYVWVTGEPRTYTDWDQGEPNGSGECVRLRAGGKWTDNSCGSSLVAICERE